MTNDQAPMTILSTFAELWTGAELIVSSKFSRWCQLSIILWMGFSFLQDPVWGKEDGSASSLIELLGDSDFAVRESATKALIQLGGDSRVDLERKFKSANDEELRGRIRLVIESIERKNLLADQLIVLATVQATKNRLELFVGGIEPFLVEDFCGLLLAEAAADQPSPGKRIVSLLSPDVRDQIANKELLIQIGQSLDPKKPFSVDMRPARKIWKSIRLEMESVVARRDLFNADYFRDALHDDAMRDMARRHKELSPVEIQIFNRRLLELSYPKFLRQNNRTLRDVTIDVYLKDTDKSTNLVLCSIRSTRWVLHGENGVQPKNVIVCGEERSEVVGTKSPVSHYCKAHKEGCVPWMTDHFSSFQVDDSQSYSHLVACLRKITGMEVTRFSGDVFRNRFDVE